MKQNHLLKNVFYGAAFDEWRKNYEEIIVNAVNEISCVKTGRYDYYIRGTEDDIIWINGMYKLDKPL